MEPNRRIGLAPVPVDLDAHLNPTQLAALHKAEEFGWSLKFVRRALVVLEYEDGSTLGVLEHDGSLNQHAVVNERSDAAPDDPDAVPPGPGKFIV